MHTIRLPKELIAVIKEKKKQEDEEKTLKIFEDFIVPFVYHTRYPRTGFDTPEDTDAERFIEYGQMHSTSPEHGSTFTLTAIKRVCKRLKDDVDNGTVWCAEYQSRYFVNKPNPFV
uniref:Uncharacterized protein n=1 Tax=Clandestinovirus TaxID=2831644 RepID=A0A8F8KSS8_9VIRU|nr:hypothetical protein KOM_12_166 [Clandestinovirus]